MRANLFTPCILQSLHQQPAATSSGQINEKAAPSTQRICKKKAVQASVQKLARANKSDHLSRRLARLEDYLMH